MLETKYKPSRSVISHLYCSNENLPEHHNFSVTNQSVIRTKKKCLQTTNLWIVSCLFSMEKSISICLLRLFREYFYVVGAKRHGWNLQISKLLNIHGTLIADLKICQYLPLHMKIICQRFHIKAPFTFWDMRMWDMWKVCLQTFRNNRIC